MGDNQRRGWCVVQIMRVHPGIAFAAALLAASPVLAAQTAAAPRSPTAAPAASWDLDGDGDRDLAVGQAGHDEGGPGQVVVHYATSAGFTEPGVVLRHPDAPEGNDSFGASLASADLDLDGYADLVVGAPSFYPRRTGYGSVTVFRGSAAGLAQESATTVAWPRRADGDLVQFGRALVVARLDSDRWPDIAVGAPDDDGDSGTDRSFVAVLRGSASGFSVSRSSTIAHPSGSRWFGEVLAAGDVDHDGDTDLLESGAYPERGSHITWLPGTRSGPRTARTLGSGWAASIAVGEVTGDRYPDVVLGRPFGSYDNGSRKPYVGPGRVTLMRGSATGPRAGVSVTQDSRGVPGREAYGDYFGQSVAIVDVNRNGRNEVAVGVPGEDVGDVKNAGSIVVLRVGATSFRRTGNRVVTQSSAGVAGDPARYGGFGAAVSALDVTGDGTRDLLVSSVGPHLSSDPYQRGTVTVLPVAAGPLGSRAGAAYVGWFGYGGRSTLAREASSQ